MPRVAAANLAAATRIGLQFARRLVSWRRGVMENLHHAPLGWRWAGAGLAWDGGLGRTQGFGEFSANSQLEIRNSPTRNPAHWTPRGTPRTQHDSFDGT